MTLAFWRWTVVSLLLTPFALHRLIAEWPVVRAQPVRIITLGAIGTSTFSLLGYWGVQYTSSMNAVLMNAAAPVFTMMLTRLALAERASLRMVISVLAGLFGTALIAAHGDLVQLITLQFNRGDLIIMVAIFAWALYTVGLRWKPPELSGMSFMYLASLAGMVACVPFWLWELNSGLHAQFVPQSIAAILYLAIFPSIAAYLCWAYAVPRVGPTIAGLFSNVTAVLGALASIVFLDEQAHLYHLVALAVVAWGVYLASSKGRAPHK